METGPETERRLMVEMIGEVVEDDDGALIGDVRSYKGLANQVLASVDRDQVISAADVVVSIYDFAVDEGNVVPDVFQMEPTEESRIFVDPRNVTRRPSSGCNAAAHVETNVVRAILSTDANNRLIALLATIVAVASILLLVACEHYNDHVLKLHHTLMKAQKRLATIEEIEAIIGRHPIVTLGYVLLCPLNLIASVLVLAGVILFAPFCVVFEGTNGLYTAGRNMLAALRHYLAEGAPIERLLWRPRATPDVLDFKMAVDLKKLPRMTRDEATSTQQTASRCTCSVPTRSSTETSPAPKRRCTLDAWPSLHVDKKSAVMPTLMLESWNWDRIPADFTVKVVEHAEEIDCEPEDEDEEYGFVELPFGTLSSLIERCGGSSI
ncbi:hypothetical protein LTR62_001382 [Meristemomyces frigidus]|uniref:Uncharacterized protein n=1 Tax=Meristemomyces frigidus TaxID=1508187 RepID=A0AAN7TB25_9PEZI|nr:hypothetical protein LTR62_001382 [Meristemomyces frigidus]